MAATPVAASAAPPPKGAASPCSGPALSIAAGRTSRRCRRAAGFTLIELLVALAAMALMAGLS